LHAKINKKIKYYDFGCRGLKECIPSVPTLFLVFLKVVFKSNGDQKSICINEKEWFEIILENV